MPFLWIATTDWEIEKLSKSVNAKLPRLEIEVDSKYIKYGVNSAVTKNTRICKGLPWLLRFRNQCWSKFEENMFFSINWAFFF